MKNFSYLPFSSSCIMISWLRLLFSYIIIHHVDPALLSQTVSAENFTNNHFARVDSAAHFHCS